MIKKIRNKLRLNIKPVEAIIRVSLAFGLTFLIALFQSLFAIILICGIASYLLITSLMLYCPLKSLFQHGVGNRKQMSDVEKEMPFKDL
jgi:hypothetical protein